MENRLNASLIDLIDGKFTIMPIVNCTKLNFINNSVGIGMSMNHNRENCFVIPLNTHLMLFIKKYKTKDSEISSYKIYEEDVVDEMNDIIFKTEIGIGNGFIFGKEEDDLKRHKNEQIINKVD